jgi:hypothetical protein
MGEPLKVGKGYHCIQRHACFIPHFPSDITASSEGIHKTRAFHDNSLGIWVMELTTHSNTSVNGVGGYLGIPFGNK